jgi:hypothetical protein
VDNIVCHWGGVLQMVSKSPSNARSYGIRALHDVALTRTSGI